VSDYQVFARKYRPLTFDDVLGQDHVIQTLRNAIEQDRLAHAYLFVGPRGTGKTSTARILAKALNCSGGPKVDFDPHEGICEEIAEGNSLDVLEIDGASNNGVDQVRELRETVSFAPASGKFKIYYIDEVHMLTTQAFNALLKTLEEPPAHVKFIFATTEPNKILPTILSRCQRFDLRRIPAGIIASHLGHVAREEGIDLDEAAAYAIAKGADGGMRDAQSMLDQLVAFCGNKITESEVLDIFGFNSQEAVAAFAAVVLNQDTSAALETVHQQSESGKDLSKLLGDLIGHFRHLLVTKVSPGVDISDVSPEIAEMLKTQAESVDTERLLTVIDSLAETDGRMKWASNKRLHLEIGVIKAVQLLGETNLSDVVALLTDAAAAAPTGGGTVAPAAAPAQNSPPPARAAAPATPEPAPAATPATTATPNPEPAPAVETAPALEPSSPAPPAAAAAAESSAGGPTPGNLEGAALWQAAVDYCRSERSLIDMWLRDAHFLSDADDVVSVGFPASKAISRDSLDRHRGFIEEAMLVIAGRKKRLSLVVRNDLEPAPPVELPPEEPPRPEPAAQAAEPATAAPTASAEAPPFSPDGPAPAQQSPTGEASPAAKHLPASDTSSEQVIDEDEFHNDELIREALTEFEATIVKTETAS
jgi:DNA polymerase-3 subunit gamma/tau